MAVHEGTDYVFASETTFTGREGVGKGCLVGTYNLLLQVPTLTTSGMGRTITTKKWRIDGELAREAVKNLLSDNELSPGDLDRSLSEIARKLSAAELIDLSTIRRLKIKSSLLSRGIYTSIRSRGAGWRGFPLKKADAVSFSEFYRGHPASMGT